jgi:hypothetical protein
MRRVVIGRAIAEHHASRSRPIRHEARGAEGSGGSIPGDQAATGRDRRSSCDHYQNVRIDSGGEPGVDGGVPRRPRANRAGERIDLYACLQSAGDGAAVTACLTKFAQ